MQLRRIGFAMATTLITASAITTGFAQNSPPAAAAPKPPACIAPEHRQFDFWLGEWEVRGPAGKLVGVNRITSLHKGCVPFEDYRAGEFSGSSLNIYDAERRKWHQTWVDSSGGLVDGKMVLAGKTIDPAKPDGTIENRITWQPLADGRVRQLWETSTDKGKTWTSTFDGYYAKQK